MEKVFDGTISTTCPDTTNHILRMTNTSWFNVDLLNTKTSQARMRATSFDLILFRIPYIDDDPTTPQVWDEGVGYDFADLIYDYSDFDKNFSDRPSNWIQTTTIGTRELILASNKPLNFHSPTLRETRFINAY